MGDFLFSERPQAGYCLGFRSEGYLAPPEHRYGESTVFIY